MIKSILVFSATVLAIASQAQAAPGLQLGVPSYGGSGCPAGSASVSLAPDNSSVSILFDQYIVEAGGATGRTLDRKSCNLAIPVSVPHGYSISLVQVDYRGYNALPMGARSQFNVEYFFAGARGPRKTKNFFGPQSSDYMLTDSLIAEAVVWSACGAQTQLRVNSSMNVFTNSSMQQALSTVDSADVSAGLIYAIQWRRCP